MKCCLRYRRSYDTKLHFGAEEQGFSLLVVDWYVRLWVKVVLLVLPPHGSTTTVGQL
jgi:hypothetical protein